MNRRQFIYGLLSSLAIAHSKKNFANTFNTNQKVLILIELKGGNDGLNTFVPFNDPMYQKLRPKLALTKDEVISFDKDIYLHKSLKKWKSLWNNKDLAIVQGLGYDEPIRSHFRSIDIWDTASDSDEFLNHGWMNDSLAFKKSLYDFEGLILGNSDPGPLQGGDIQSLVIKNQKQFLKRAKKIKKSKRPIMNNSLAHFDSIQSDIQRSYQMIQNKMNKSLQLTEFSKDKLSRSLKSAAEFIISGINVPVIKITHGGFDTHSNQKNTHARLLKQLATATTSFKEALIKHNLWDKVTLATYSEFGRRAEENGSKGSDHGTANTHFVMGANVKGGLYGQKIDLTNLINKDLVHTNDFRNYLKTLIEKGLDIEAPLRLKKFSNLNFIT
ncbi:MAG: hypothetical protein COB02_06035 [Candidatus Cloacimonadota bacterium]|nr:MAG: hypothetical protein COB02_12055 [Candidatus Cloacimonadota bacterium]PCJ20158.1 MAG: hypothetical protein COB02_06035 [Candidatus Cloacimonadota bacterium]